MSTVLRKMAQQSDDVFEFVRHAQSSRFKGCSGARELAAVWRPLSGCRRRRARCCSGARELAAVWHRTHARRRRPRGQGSR